MTLEIKNNDKAQEFITTLKKNNYVVDTKLTTRHDNKEVITITTFKKHSVAYADLENKLIVVGALGTAYQDMIKFPLDNVLTIYNI